MLPEATALPARSLTEVRETKPSIDSRVPLEMEFPIFPEKVRTLPPELELS